MQSDGVHLLTYPWYGLSVPRAFTKDCFKHKTGQTNFAVEGLYQLKEQQVAIVKQCCWSLSHVSTNDGLEADIWQLTRSPKPDWSKEV